MASFTITGFSSTAQTLAGTEFGFVGKDGTILVSSGQAITTTANNRLTIEGTVANISDTFNTSALYINGSTVRVIIGPQASVSSHNGDAINAQISNWAVVENAGHITSGSDGVDIDTSDGASSINLSNTGTINGQQNGLVLDAGASLASVVNTGTIIGFTNVGIFMNFGFTSTGTTVLKNSGTIAGFNASFSSASGTGPNNIFNSGLMDGNISLGAGADRYDGNGGQVIGTVFGLADNDTLAGGDLADSLDGGTGDDLVIGRGGDDVLDGNDGNDVILGGAGNDQVSGGADNDTMNGQDGDDTMDGGTGNDAMTGGAGADEMSGGADNDTMNGQDGDDILEGEGGDDILRGGNGDDALAGGEGADLLTGGAGFDSFVFRALPETAAGALRDQILDFAQGVDLIVVAGLSPGVFEFRGTAAFDPSGNPELRLFETSTGSTIVQVDADGNGTIDAEIRVANVTGLTAEDFVL